MTDKIKQRIRFKREKAICPKCNKEVIKLSGDNGYVSLMDDDVIFQIVHRCKNG